MFFFDLKCKNNSTLIYLFSLEEVNSSYSGAVICIENKQETAYDESTLHNYYN